MMDGWKTFDLSVVGFGGKAASLLFTVVYISAGQNAPRVSTGILVILTLLKDPDPKHDRRLQTS